MRREIRLPQWGMGMTEGTIVEWLKAEGARVAEDDPLALVESAKVETELEAPFTGVLGEIVVPAGETVDVGTVLAFIETDDTT
ncbi:MAG: biotin attachment protein [Nitriliruptorales bacterium]|nr:biotin attachment protein [Nitriliruptorales bacterium]